MIKLSRFIKKMQFTKCINLFLGNDQTSSVFISRECFSLLANLQGLGEKSKRREIGEREREREETEKQTDLKRGQERK